MAYKCNKCGIESEVEQAFTKVGIGPDYDYYCPTCQQKRNVEQFKVSLIWYILAGLLGFFNSGWYAILQGRLYTALPSKSASIMVLSNLAGLLGGLLPLVIGLVADGFGLQTAMWMLLAGPIALMVGLALPTRIDKGKGKSGMP